MINFDDLALFCACFGLSVNDLKLNHFAWWRNLAIFGQFKALSTPKQYLASF